MYVPLPVSLPSRSQLWGTIVGEYFVPEGTRVQLQKLARHKQEYDSRKIMNHLRCERWLGGPESSFDRQNLSSQFLLVPDTV